MAAITGTAATAQAQTASATGTDQRPAIVMPDPRFMAFPDWARAAAGFRGVDGYVPQPTEDGWREWASAFNDAPANRIFPLPEPRREPDWASYAFAAIHVLGAGI